MTEEQGAQQSPDANTDKKSFGKDVGKLVSGTVVAQVVGICLMPIITRIFSPEIYGLAAIFTSIVSILTGVSCLQYELAIILPKEDKDAGSVFCACLSILFCFSIVLIPVFFFFGDTILGWFNGPELSSYVMLIPLLVFIDGLYLVMRYWNTRKKRFGTQATTQVIQSISGNGLKLGFGLGGLVNAGSLIIAQIIGQTLGTLVLFFQMIRYDAAKIRAGCSLTAIKAQMLRYKKFPLINTWSQLVNTVSWQLPVLMLSGLFSSTIAGLYTLGFMMLQLPMSLIGGSIGQVFFQRASVAKHEGNLPSVVEDTCSLLFLLSICPFLLLCVVGGDLFSIVFGEIWRDAGIFAQILALWTLLWFVSSPMSSIISVLEIQGFGMMTSTANLITRFLSLLIGAVFGNVYLAIVLFALSGVVIYGYCIYVFVTRAGGSMRVVWKNIHNTVYIWIGLAGLLAILSLSQISAYLLCGMAVLIGVLYIMYLVRKNPLVKEYLF